MLLKEAKNKGTFPPTVINAQIYLTEKILESPLVITALSEPFKTIVRDFVNMGVAQRATYTIKDQKFEYIDTVFQLTEKGRKYQLELTIPNLPKRELKRLMNDKKIEIRAFRKRLFPNYNTWID